MSRIDPARLVDPKALLALYPGIKPRTLRYWIENAPARVLQQLDGPDLVVPGNGLGRAIIHKGRVTLIDPELFREWLYEGVVEVEARSA